MPHTRWNKKILTVLMQWDHGHKERGLSGDVKFFHANFEKLASNVVPFWYDEYFSDLPRLQTELLRRAEAVDPDLIFFLPYTDQVATDTLDALKAKWKTCAWFGDDTWRFESYTAKMAPHYSYPVTTDPFSVRKYRDIGISPVVSQWGAQLNGDKPGIIPPEKYDYDISFVGGHNKFRAWLVGRLRKLGLAVNTFGPGWPEGKVSFEQMEEIFRKSRINLNLSNSINQDIRFVLSNWRNLASYLRSPKRTEQIKARNFEIPLAGGFQLTNYAIGLEKYLRIGEEVAVFTTPEDCASQIAYYLEHEAERTQVLLAGHARAMREHTYLRRLEGVLREIWGNEPAQE